MKKQLLIMACGLTLTAGTFACSNVYIAANGFAATARTMDFEFNTGYKFAEGKPGDNNKSSINEKGVIVPTAVWKNTYGFVGQAWRDSPIVIDGLNTEGVYAGFLYLPHFTRYPKFDKTLHNRPALGVMDTVNYVLGTSKDVPDALENLQQYQIISSAIEVDGKHHPGIFGVFPLHLVIRDNTGASAVIEWVNGKEKIYKNAGPVLTNAPTYDWQVSHAKQYNYVKTKGTKALFDGEKMLGTGFTGIPGDYSSPSRFAKLTQIIAHTPKPLNDIDAERSALTILEAAQVPPGTNESPTLWKSISNQNKDIYTVIRMIDFQSDDNKTIHAVAPSQMLRSVNVKRVTSTRQQPQGWTPAVIKTIPQSAINKVMDFTHNKISAVIKKEDK